MNELQEEFNFTDEEIKNIQKLNSELQEVSNDRFQFYKILYQFEINNNEIFHIMFKDSNLNSMIFYLSDIANSNEISYFEFDKFINEYELDIDSLNSNGQNILFHSIIYKHCYKEQEEFILIRGIDITIKDNFGKYAIDYAFENDMPDTIELFYTLIENHSDSLLFPKMIEFKNYIDENYIRPVLEY